MLNIISTRRSGWESVMLPWKETSLSIKIYFAFLLCTPGDGHYPGETIEMFSFPEYSSMGEQIEARTLDYTHILNNLKMQCTQHGLSYCSKEAFHAVCKKRPDILSCLIVYDCIDPQWAVFAEKVFS